MHNMGEIRMVQSPLEKINSFNIMLRDAACNPHKKIANSDVRNVPRLRIMCANVFAMGSMARHFCARCLRCLATHRAHRAVREFHRVANYQGVVAVALIG